MRIYINIMNFSHRGTATLHRCPLLLYTALVGVEQVLLKLLHDDEWRYSHRLKSSPSPELLLPPLPPIAIAIAIEPCPLPLIYRVNYPYQTDSLQSRHLAR